MTVRESDNSKAHSRNNLPGIPSGPHALPGSNALRISKISVAENIIEQKLQCFSIITVIRYTSNVKRIFVSEHTVEIFVEHVEEASLFSWNAGGGIIVCY